MKKLALHWKILIGMILGIVFGFIMLQIEGGGAFIADWIKPIGSIFVKLLKIKNCNELSPDNPLVALVLAYSSLICSKCLCPEGKLKMSSCISKV